MECYEVYQPNYQQYYDSGVVTATALSLTKSVPYGQGSTPESVAASLANAFNADANFKATASANGATVSFRAKQCGSTNNQTMSASVSWDSANFGSASFNASKSGMNGGWGPGPF